MKNNNSEVIRLLAGKLFVSNRRRNHILTGAVALSLFLLFSVFSIVTGRINAQKLAYTRMAGTAATTFLEDATLDQAEQIAKLDYIRDVGMEYIFGQVYSKQAQAGTRAYVDQTTFDTMLKPAYTQIHGTYPEKENEIMLSARTLETLGIREPETGMSIKIMDQEGKEEELILSGFYTEFLDETATPPYAFFSRQYYENHGYSMEQAALLAIRQKDWYDGENIEDLLYQDIPTIDSAQQFIGGDSVSYTAVLELVGGIDIGLCCALLIILCAGMLIYNVVALSLRREIRQYGLLKTLGTTSRQIRRIAWRQVAKILPVGLAAGTAAGGFFVLGILPRILEGKYLEGFGEASAIISFHPLLLLGAILLTITGTLLSCFTPIRKVGKLAPVSALHYLGGIVRTGRKTRHSNKGNQIAVMAWRNIFRDRKSAFVTLGSLLLGFTVALGAMVIIRGIDYRNQLEQDDDFNLSAMSAPFLSDGYYEPDVCFSPSFLKEIEALDGIEEIKCSVGGYLKLNSQDAVWQPLLVGSRLGEGMQDNDKDKAYAEHVRKYYMAGFTVVDQIYIDALEQCCKKNDLTLDIEGLREGTSAVAFHFNNLSRQLNMESISSIGKPFSLKTFSGKDLGTINFGGYLKRNQKDLPPCDTEASTSGYPSLLISEKCFKRLGIDKKVFAVNINVTEKMEPKIKWKLNHMIEELEKKTTEQEGVFGTGYSIYSKSDALASAESDLLPVRILMYTVSALLICMGLFNYFNATASSLETRKTEFVMLENLGMTKKQLRHMLILEGGYYSSFICVFLTTAGNGIMWLLYRFVKDRIPYMQFHYPVAGLILLLTFIYAGCICLPLWMLHSGKNTTAGPRAD